MVTPYIDAEEAKTLIAGLRGKDAAQAFDALDPIDQAASLAAGMLKMNRLPFLGSKTDPDQANAFPRKIKGTDVGIPQAVKAALAIQAAAEHDGSEAGALARIRKEGVTDYRLDDFSVSFSKDETRNRASATAILEEEALLLLEPYIRKGGPVHVG